MIYTIYTIYTNPINSNFIDEVSEEIKSKTKTKIISYRLNEDYFSIDVAVKKHIDINNIANIIDRIGLNVYKIESV